MKIFSKFKTSFRRPFATFHPHINATATTVSLKNPRGKLPDNLLEVKFGREFSDHMVSIDWKEGLGYSTPEITPLRNISLHPASPGLHYAIQAFEGSKVFRCSDGIRSFRLDKNLDRFSRSMHRVGLPTLSDEDKAGILQLIYQLVTIDKQFVPDLPGYSLYIRPVAFGVQATLGVVPPSEYRMLIFASPVGPYFQTGFKPVKLLAPTCTLRAFEGSSGSYKVGANYGPTIEPFSRALRQGYDQILWLYPDSKGYVITEAGTMNVFVYWISEDTGKPELVTPPLGDLILPGITRDSIITLGKSGKIEGLEPHQVTEKHIYIEDVKKALDEGRLLEMFGSGTAAIVCPISAIRFESETFEIPTDAENHAGDMCKKLLMLVQSCQRGEGPPEMAEWSQIVCQ